MRRAGDALVVEAVEERWEDVDGGDVGVEVVGEDEGGGAGSAAHVRNRQIGSFAEA